MSEKASFAAAASQLWNQNKSTLGTKSFNISLTNDKDKSEIKSTSDVSANRTTGHVFGSGIFSKAGQTVCFYFKIFLNNILRFSG